MSHIPRPKGFQPQISKADAQVQLSMLLLNCTDERLAGFDGTALARMYRVHPATIETMLSEERQRREEYRLRTGTANG